MYSDTGLGTNVNIAIIGTGYVGLVSGTCFSEMGLRVFCVDTDREKIAKLQRGEVPIYEPGLAPLVEKNSKEGRLTFHTSLAECLDEVEVVFIAVGTPADERGKADLRYVFAVAEELGQLMTKRLLVVTKSTVPVGTTHRVQDIIRKGLEKRGLEELEMHVASNPEFLKEGAAIKDFMSPDRVIVGVESGYAREVMSKIYRPFLINNFRVLFMDILSSELTKYASNAMLATRISFMNELANLAEVLGADVEQIRRGMGADARIGTSFLYPGVGYGGSCFPKDVQALAQTARERGKRLRIVEQVHEVNELQKQRPLEKLHEHLSEDLRGKVIAVWGLAFKPETDDMREAPSGVLIPALIKEGATVQACDPVAIETAKWTLPQEGITYHPDIYEAARGADAVVLLTEWRHYRMPQWEQVKSVMRGNLIVDGRNIYLPHEVREAGLRYTGIGKN